MTFLQADVIKVARAVAKAWSLTAISNADSAAGMGVVAALLLLSQQETEEQNPERRILAASDEEIAQVLEGAWRQFAITRPELAFRCVPFAKWLNEEPRDPRNVVAAAAVARAAIKAGLWRLANECGNAQKVDVLAHCNLLLRNSEAPRDHCQHYTPAPVAEALAGMTLVPEHDESVCDPFAGTGGLLRGAAENLRGEGKDPHDFWWCGCDIDPVVVAALAVNVHIWDLGPRVLIGCANVLKEPDWNVRAGEEQMIAVETREALAFGASLLAAASTAKSADRGRKKEEA
jgi:N-6 DNA Methylase